MGEELTVTETSDHAVAMMPREEAELSISQIVGKVAKVREVAAQVMKEKVHFGTIPGTPKPTLYKPGAEILCLTFRLAPRYAKEVVDCTGGHREYIVSCDLYHINTGVFWGSGHGSCSTMESKYRFRTGPKESTGSPVPKEYWNMRNSDPARAQELIGGKGYSTMKDDAGQWVICAQGERVEHDNPADYYNTVLKMACKRAYIDAVLKATAASEAYTQDIEDMRENDAAYAGANAQPQQKPPVQQPRRRSDPPPPEPPPYMEDPGYQEYAPAPEQPAPQQAAQPQGAVISRKQSNLLWARGLNPVEGGRGALTDTQVQELVRLCGYEHIADIKMSDFDRVLKVVMDGK